MTQEEWNSFEAPDPMLKYLEGDIEPNLLREFGIRCCKRIWDLLDEESRSAVNLAEQMNSGVASLEEVTSLKNSLKERYLAFCEERFQRKKKNRILLWAMGAAKNLLQDNEAYLNREPVMAGEPRLAGAISSAASAVAHKNSGWFKPDPPRELFEEKLEQANILRQLIPSPPNKTLLPPDRLI